jgi:penicillin amidase
MYADLQDPDNQNELALARIRDVVPPALHALLAHDGSSWDAPLQGEPRGDAQLPDAAQLDLRSLAAAPAAPAPEADAVGSNNFAVAGALTADGRAIIADDMHLALRAPSLWFRVRLRYPDPKAPGGQVDVSGFSLPGVPAVIVGSNGHVAWGFTNSYGDYLDWRQEIPCAGEPAAAATAASPSSEAPACTPVTRHRESILVAGAAPVAFDVRETAWGPILHDLPEGKALSLRWAAQLPGSLNFGLSNFAKARDLAHALQIADQAATPTQNLVIGDSGGQIAWRLLGPLPTRAAGCATPALVDVPGRVDAQAASAMPTACPPWSISTSASPTLRSPDVDRLWTANARVVDGALLARIGDGGYALGARARQIRDDLQARQQFSERDLLTIQLDDRAELLSRWRTLLQARAEAQQGEALPVLAAAARDWSGHARIDSVGYRVVRAWRLAVNDRLRDGLLAPARAALGEDVEMPELQQLEGIAWPLVTQRPAHLLPRRFDSWEALFEDAAVEVRDDLAARGPLSERTWGEHNTAAICHPLAAAVPLLGKRWLCMPADPLPGDGMMARVQGPAFGASQRMVVAPGHEADGIIHMPGGQSGHPLSPFWGAGHADWVAGRATPFLPGAERNRLTLTPGR